MRSLPLLLSRRRFLVTTGPLAATAKGAVALWFEGSTIAHFANLKITPR